VSALSCFAVTESDLDSLLVVVEVSYEAVSGGCPIGS
jgi:hypothetical protein